STLACAHRNPRHAPRRSRIIALGERFHVRAELTTFHVAETTEIEPRDFVEFHRKFVVAEALERTREVIDRIRFHGDRTVPTFVVNREREGDVDLFARAERVEDVLAVLDRAGATFIDRDRR